MKQAFHALLFFLSLTSFGQSGPFAPQAGTAGTTAMHKDSAVFRDWALTCQVQRGLRQIDLPDSGYATAGSDIYATGRADAPLTVSLGDGGSAVLSFTAPFHDGEGADFAVFENGFGSGVDAFLEFAFVEVSSDGTHFVRFPSTSLIDTSTQTASFGNTDASVVDGLAGKYTSGFGVPFDLADIPDTSILNKEAVTHVRIVDVVGSILDDYATFDAQGQKVNDPWPTNFPQSGFDLDAVGIIHSNLPVGLKDLKTTMHSAASACFDMLGRPIDCRQAGMVIERRAEQSIKVWNAAP